MNIDHEWIEEVVRTPDIRLRSHRVTFTYNKLSQQCEDVTFFDFATWGTHMVGRVIRGEIPDFALALLQPVHEEVAQHLGFAQLSMFDHITHAALARGNEAWCLKDMLEASFEEQSRVNRGINDACNTVADHWGTDRDHFAQYLTLAVPGAELPNETLRPCERVKGTSGPIGAACTDYRSLEQRLAWLEGVITTHLDDRSLKGCVYTPEEEKWIVDGLGATV